MGDDDVEAIGQATDGGDGISWRRVARREAAGRQRRRRGGVGDGGGGGGCGAAAVAAAAPVGGDSAGSRCKVTENPQPNHRLGELPEAHVGAASARLPSIALRPGAQREGILSVN